MFACPVANCGGTSANFQGVVAHLRMVHKLEKPERDALTAALKPAAPTAAPATPAAAPVGRPRLPQGGCEIRRYARENRAVARYGGAPCWIALSKQRNGTAGRGAGVHTETGGAQYRAPLHCAVHTDTLATRNAVKDRGRGVPKATRLPTAASREYLARNYGLGAGRIREGRKATLGKQVTLWPRNFTKFAITRRPKVEIYSGFGDALERLKALGGNARHNIRSGGTLSRVSDGAFWEPMCAAMASGS